MGANGCWEAPILVSGGKYGLFIVAYLAFWEATKGIVDGVNT